LTVFVFFLFSGCGSDVDNPLLKIKASLKDVPNYSIILENMKEEGNFVKSYFHKYRIVKPEGAETTDWLKVPEPIFQQYEKFLGMTILAQKDGKVDDAVVPPGYHYVGDTRYGQWRSDGRGGNFWEFYGQYRLMTDFLGGWYRPVYDVDYDAYKKFKKRKVPYYGLKNQYGTSGTIVKKTKPDFYSRYTAKQAAKSASFTDKVSKRIGRSRTTVRGRSGGRGK
jgi:hypothetical protein